MAGRLQPGSALGEEHADVTPIAAMIAARSSDGERIGEILPSGPRRDDSMRERTGSSVASRLRHDTMSVFGPPAQQAGSAEP